MAKYKHVRPRGEPQLLVLRNDLAETNWTIHLSTEDDIEPFLTAAAAALEAEPSEHFSRLTITPQSHTRGSCTNTIIPLCDTQASEAATHAELKLLAFLKETAVLPPEAGLEELCQWGQANGLPYRVDLRREAKNLYKNETFKEILPGVKVPQYEGSVAHTAAQAVDPSILEQGAGPRFRSERRLLKYLKKIGALHADAGWNELYCWGRSHGMYRRADIQRAGSALLKSGVTTAQLEPQRPAAVPKAKSAGAKKKKKKKKKKKAREADDSATQGLNAAALLAWLQQGGSITQHTAVSQPISNIGHALCATNEAQYAPRPSRDQGGNIIIPGLAERLAERGELKVIRNESPRRLGQGISHWHSSEPLTDIKQAGGCASSTAAQFAADKKARSRMHEQLNSLKRRSLIDTNATFEHLPAWKQANALAGEDWQTTLKRVVSERAHRDVDKEITEQIPGPARILSKEDLESSEPRHQLEWVKKQGLLTADKGVEDMHHWREANAKEGDSFSDFAMRMVISPPVPSKTQKDKLNRLKGCGLLHRGATFADMQRWTEANVKEGESLKAVVKRLTAGNVGRQAGTQGNLEMLAQAERDHANGTLKDESRAADQGESSSENDDVEFILE